MTGSGKATLDLFNEHRCRGWVVFPQMPDTDEFDSVTCIIRAISYKELIILIIRDRWG